MELNDDEALRRFFQERFKNYEPEHLELRFKNENFNYGKIRKFITIMTVVSIMLVNFTVIQMEPHSDDSQNFEIVENQHEFNSTQSETATIAKNLPASLGEEILEIQPDPYEKNHSSPDRTLEAQNGPTLKADPFPISEQKLDLKLNMGMSEMKIKPIYVSKPEIADQAPTSHGFPWSISLGPYVNFNWFKPRQHDRYLVSSFQQNKNLLDNRLGFQLQANIGLIRFKKFSLSPTFRYSYLHKSYSFNVTDLNVEEPASSSIQIDHAFHFVGVGFQLELPKGKTSAGLHYLKMLNNSPGLNSHQLEFQVSTRMQIGKGKKPFVLEPTIGYTIPLSEMPFLRVSMINLGLKTRVARSN